MSDDASPIRQADARELEPRFRQLVSTLCWIACGRSKSLDDEMARIIRIMHRGATAAELDDAQRQLTAAVGAPSATTADAASVNANAVALAPLLRLLENLAAIKTLDKPLSAIRSRASQDNATDVNEVADKLGALVLHHCNTLQTERDSLITLLDQMNSGLGELSSHMNTDAKFRQQAHDQSRALSQQLLGEVVDLGANVRQASSLQALQEDVRRGLERINSSVQEARAREEARMQSFEQRAEQMKSRIDRLEAETQQLRHSVASEHQSACTDRLTGLPNRFAYDLRIKQEQLHSQQTGVPLVLAVWDIDRFKAVNDTFGHHAGDKALQAVGHHLAQQLRGSDFCARYGGEEFVMILRNLPLEQALATANRLRSSVAKIAFHFRQQPITLTLSCGLTLMRVDDSAESAFERADKALYRAKHEGRNRCVAE